jgi:D-alanyl-D-alanine carboxypeptidase (penicillin-binding protein 5/6)
MGKHFNPFIYILILMWVNPCWSEPLNFNINGEAALLMNADTGAILLEKNAYTLKYPASTTKISTALYALHLLGTNLDTKVVADAESLKSLNQEAKIKANFNLPGYWLEPDGTHIGLKVGEELTYRNLLEGVLIASGNDASNVIAQNLGPTIPKFMEGLNAFIKNLGCQNTNYYNPHGLHHPKHMTTAFDLACMTKAALKNPIFCEIVGMKRFNRPKTNKQNAATFLQSNRLLRPGKFYYPKAIGVKTGYHSRAKKTFVGAARFEGRTLIAVLLGYQDRNAIFIDAIKLFDAAFNQPKVERIYLKKGPQSFMLQMPQADRMVNTFLTQDLSWSYYPAEDPQAKCFLQWKELNLPIAKGQEVAELQLKSSDGLLLKRVSLIASTHVKRIWPYSWLANLEAFYGSHPVISILYIILLLMSLGVSFWLVRHGDFGS